MIKKHRYIFDIEADGFDATKVHCLSYYDIDEKTSGTYSDYKDIINFLDNSRLLIGHNIVRYDIPTLERLLEVKVKTRLVDTLAISWYIRPDLKTHGLDDWGERFGIPKPKIDDWENLTPEEYQHRCEEDVKINTKLWNDQVKRLFDLYGDRLGVDRLIDYLTFKMDCAALQEKCRWKVDVDRCEEGLAELVAAKEGKVKALESCMPEVPRKVKRTKPKKPYKQDGTLSAAGERWFKLLEEKKLPKEYKGDVEVVVGFEAPNPNSHAQLKSWLHSLGWKPKESEYKYKRNKETNEFKKIEQINKKDPGEEGVCESVKELFDKEPNLVHLDGLFIITNRVGTLKGFLSNMDDEGYVKAQINGLTNTMRFKHKVCVNLPGVDKPYGELIRGCLISPEGMELCGSDMSSLEDRTKQHYMWSYDPEFVKEQMSEDFDPHLDIGLSSGLMTSSEVEEYRENGSHSSKRHDCKQINYSCTYGVTPKGIVRNTGMPLDKATLLHGAYWTRNWAIKAIADDAEVKQSKGLTWIYNPVSGFWYNLRADKDRFSTLNQGTGVYCFDTWVKYILKQRRELTAQFHDEVVLCIKLGNRERCENMLRKAMYKANKELGLSRELDIDVQFGENYSEIH